MVPDPVKAANDLTGLALGAGLGIPEEVGTLKSFGGWHGTPHVFEPVEGHPFGKFEDKGNWQGKAHRATAGGIMWLGTGRPQRAIKKI